MWLCIYFVIIILLYRCPYDLPTHRYVDTVMVAMHRSLQQKEEEDEREERRRLLKTQQVRVRMDGADDDLASSVEVDHLPFHHK